MSPQTRYLTVAGFFFNLKLTIMTEIIIFIFDHLLFFMIAGLLGYLVYSLIWRNPLRKPRFKVHDVVYGQDYKNLQGDYVKCRVINVHTSWDMKNNPTHNYSLIIESSGKNIRVVEKQVKTIKELHE
jgi:hypothetical protein